ncbi:MAG: type II toxin-antitoxin system HipA family toxin [Sinobacterium sp.]|nr:type II toxin-antitoxin system HipA family toxin [Sinobacterium sp.]
MVKEVISVNYEGSIAGAASFDTETGSGAFEYDENFIAKGIELSPIKMPLAKKIYTFPELSFDTFKGLPGLLSDSLPDDFGNAVMNAWIATQGKSPDDISPLQRLQYTGKRGMGALEYSPATQAKGLNTSKNIEIETLVTLAQEMLDSREKFEASISSTNSEDEEGMRALMSVGMSAGGARPKAVLAFNKNFTQARSGQVNAPDGFTHYLMKFDGVSEHSKGKETFGDPMGYGAMEFSYYKMAKLCGINMMHSKLLCEGNRQHFITQRFDRIANKKQHVQTLNGIAHVDYKKPGTYSYAEIFSVARKLRISASDADQLLRRMIFNIVARNHDDHAKNFSFMLSGSNWKLSPAYDLAYSYKAGSKWVNSHWMSLNGKRDDFTREDIYSLQSMVPSFSKAKIDHLLNETTEHVSQWAHIAKENNVPKTLIDEVFSNLRLNI